LYPQDCRLLGSFQDFFLQFLQALAVLFEYREIAVYDGIQNRVRQIVGTVGLEGDPPRPELLKERKLYREGGKYMIRNDERAPEDPAHWTDIKINEAIILLEKWKENHSVTGCVVLLYDHHKKDLLNKSIHIQHKYQNLILSVQHVHLDHHNCLETIALKGKANQLRSLADELIALKGMKHGDLVMSVID